MSSFVQQYNSTVDVWNHLSSDQKTIIVSIVIIAVVTVATAGLGDAFVAPVLFGATLGGGVSGIFYGSSCGNHCTPEGWASHILSGIALGGAGGLAGPVAGAFGSEFGGAAGGLAVSRAVNAGIAIGGSMSVDAAYARSPSEMLGDAVISGAIGLATGDDAAKAPSGSFKQVADWIAERPEARDVLGAIGSSAGGEFYGDYLAPTLASLLGW